MHTHSRMHKDLHTNIPALMHSRNATTVAESATLAGNAVRHRSQLPKRSSSNPSNSSNSNHH